MISTLLGSFFFHLYKIRSGVLQGQIRYLVGKMEGGEPYSETLRRIFRAYHGVDIGLYTHGGCFDYGAMDRYTTIGRYCSIARPVRVLNHNHPLVFKSTHAFFFNASFGHCGKDRTQYTPLSIGNDVWVGTNALILPHVKRIGDGAVIAAGAVVHNDVSPYAVVVGNPARTVRFRFPREVIEELLQSRWWDKPIEALAMDDFCGPYQPKLVPEEFVDVLGENVPNRPNCA